MTLADGARIGVRPVEPGDRRRLEEGLERLSPRSRYQRFFVPTDQLSDRDWTYLTTIDHRRHEALLGIDAATGEGVGVARYVVIDADPVTADIAVTVADAWQGRGVGRALLRRLAERARENGIERFSGLILAENTPMLRLMAGLGPVVSRTPHGGTVELVVDLGPGGRRDGEVPSLAARQPARPARPNVRPTSRDTSIAT